MVGSVAGCVVGYVWWVEGLGVKGVHPQLRMYGCVWLVVCGNGCGWVSVCDCMWLNGCVVGVMVGCEVGCDIGCKIGCVAGYVAGCVCWVEGLGV